MIALLEQNSLIGALGAIAGCAVASLCLIWMSYRRFIAREAARMAQARADIVDMTILAQTMRDIIIQQKALAKQFNEELDRKMRLVKQVIEKGVEQTEELRAKQFKLAQRLDEALEELASVQRQIAFFKDGVPAATREPLPEIPKLTDEPVTGRKEEVRRQAPPETAPLISIRVETPPPPAEKPEYLLSAFADWLDADIGAEREPDTEPELEEEPLDESLPAEHPEEFRDAFRALLNLPAQSAPVKTPPAKEPPEKPKRAKAGNNGDGIESEEAKALAPLQQRVLEYSAAGMDIPRIARELGIGKGEVRLMLSLARKKA